MKPRAALDELEVVEHGGKREGATQHEVLDFSVSLNPYGPPAFVSEAIYDALQDLDKYPDTECSVLRAQIAHKFGCDTKEILVGAGVSELIQLIAFSFIKNRVLMPKHTYGEYEHAAKLMGAQIKRVAMPGLRIDPELIVEELKNDDVLFLCNPNNPTGQYLGKKEIERILEEVERVDALLVLDEAYVDFVADAFPSHNLPMSNLIILRSLTKSFAIPGLRIGYAIASADSITAMAKVKVPWSVSVCAQRVGAAVIGNAGDAFLADTRERIELSKRRIESILNVHSDANFFIFDVGTAHETKQELLTHSIQVRDCTSFGLPSHIRFSVKRDDENDRLLHYLQMKA